MAEVKNTFIKSKMNKDLDDRILSKGEYRDALNVSVSKSEDSDVGALENALGNLEVTDLGLSVDYGLSMIGHFMDPSNDRMFLMLTNYIDVSADQLSNFATSNSGHYIYVYYNLTNTYHKLIEGEFLNFSKTHPISGINLLEDLLFWTDNRNQPRKINVVSAENSSTYYQTEDTISVAKFYPSKPIDLYKQEIVGIARSGAVISGYQSDGTKFPAGAHSWTNVTTSGSATGTGLTVDFDASASGAISSLVVNNFGSGYVNSDTVVIDYIDGMTVTGGTQEILTLTVGAISTMRDVTSPLLPDDVTANPYYDANWDGDSNFLKDKFIRFSYRFKFDDGEYSLMSPFTQPAFVPDQDGYFKQHDEDKAFTTTEVKFMENKVDDINLIINSPNGIGFRDLYSDLKVTDIEILYKESNGLSIKVVDTINQVDWPTEGSILQYNYKSQKAYKTLPEREIVRVFDKVPIRALAQEVIGNRICYGNYLDKHTPPRSIDYTVDSGIKNTEAAITPSYVRKEYQNHTLKQNRTYQVGIILSDRYGRQSDVVLSNEKDSTLYHTYKTWLNDFTTALPKGNSTDLINNTDTWPGDSLKVTFNNVIPEAITSDLGYPGIYSINNPLGWYSYKIVVKQQEQDYYNVYNAGILNGYTNDWNGANWVGRVATDEDPICHVALFGDNINKIPRDLTNSGNQDRIFRSARPTYEEDPSYYKFVVEYGLGQESATLDLGETSQKIKGWDAELRQRDRERGIFDVDNASVKMYCRVTNYRDTSGVPTSLPDANKRFIWVDGSGNFPSSRIIEPDNVNTISTGVDLGLWDPANLDTTAVPAEPSPSATATEFYNYQSNPPMTRISADANWLYLGSYSNANATMIPTLAVYETAPQYSRLDLFWETSTTGLVSELNTSILAADSDIPVTLGYLATPSFFLNENLASGVQCSAPFKAYNVTPAVLNTATMVLSSVIDGYGTNRTSEFTLFNDYTTSPGSYYLETNSTFWYGSDSKSRKFNFVIEVTNVGKVSNLELIGSLENTSPVFIAPAAPVAVAGAIGGSVLYTLQAGNGSSDATLRVNELSWNIHSINGAPYTGSAFYIKDISNGKAELINHAVPAQVITVVARVVDGGGKAIRSDIITATIS